MGNNIDEMWYLLSDKYPPQDVEVEINHKTGIRKARLSGSQRFDGLDWIFTDCHDPIQQGVAYREDIRGWRYPKVTRKLINCGFGAGYAKVPLDSEKPTEKEVLSFNEWWKTNKCFYVATVSKEDAKRMWREFNQNGRLERDLEVRPVIEKAEILIKKFQGSDIPSYLNTASCVADMIIVLKNLKPLSDQ